MQGKKHSFHAAPLALLLLLAACADMPSASGSAASADDPLEPMNRHLFDNNRFFDDLLVRPLAELYRATIPPPVRGRVADIVSNMKEPVIFANDLLQGNFGKAGVTAERFGINTTLGVGGMFDIAGDWSLPQQTGDFGQTLAVWGVGEGPYLILPLFGPSDARDAVGLGVDIAMSPWQYFVAMDGTASLVRYEAAYHGTEALIKRERNIENIDALRKGSLDYYAKIRSAWRQHRREQIGE